MTMTPPAVFAPEVPLSDRALIESATSAQIRFASRPDRPHRFYCVSLLMWYDSSVPGKVFAALVSATAAAFGAAAATHGHGDLPDRLAFLGTNCGLFTMLLAPFARVIPRRDPDYRVIMAVRRHAGQFHRPDSFDATGSAQIIRAHRAVEAVETSEARHAGLLEDVTAATALDTQLWEIANQVAEQSDLRRGAKRLRKKLNVEVQDQLRRQTESLSASERSTDRRIEALEEYAAQVKALDGDLHRQRTALKQSRHDAEIGMAIRARDEQLLALLSEEARDDVAVEDLQRFTTLISQVRHVLADLKTAEG